MVQIREITPFYIHGGISWTTSLEYAEKYKEMFNKKMILQATIDKSKVFAYINRNAEFEVIVF